MTKPLLLLALTLLSAAVLQSAPLPALLPQPQQVTLPEAETAPFVFGPATRLCADAAFLREADTAARRLRTVTGLSLPLADAPGDAPALVLKQIPGLPAEGYTLTVTPKRITVEATDAAGAFYGLQTLFQLLPPAVYGKAPAKDTVWSVPTLTVRDAPRLKWRGIMLDEARHFMGEQAVLTLLDTMAAHKLNVFHWHLTDNQGWRIEIKRYPQLTKRGAVRKQSQAPRSPRGPTYAVGDGTPYGPFFYTQDQIRRIVAYAAERHITVVPEIDMPGHPAAAIAAMPELSCRGVPTEVQWIFCRSEEAFCAGSDTALEILGSILDEVMDLFPSHYIHLGGDEVAKTRWKACPKCRARMKAEGITDYSKLQTWFMMQMEKRLSRRGRAMIGWDEILTDSLGKSAAVMSWRGSAGGIRAAKAGHDAVMSPCPQLYLDHAQGVANDPYEYFAPNPQSVENAYAFNPTRGLDPEAAKHIIGIQANLWTEYVLSPKMAEWKIWPRACAVAEIGWTPQAQRSLPDFRERLRRHRNRRLTRMLTNPAPVVVGRGEPAPVRPRAPEKKALRAPVAARRQTMNDAR